MFERGVTHVITHTVVQQQHCHSNANSKQQPRKHIGGRLRLTIYLIAVNGKQRLHRHAAKHNVVTIVQQQQRHEGQRYHQPDGKAALSVQTHVG